MSVTFLVGEEYFESALFTWLLVEKELLGAYVDELEGLRRMH